MGHLGDRRYRLNGDEVGPVMQLVRERLSELLEERINIEEATVLYRILWRHNTYQVGRPTYPDPITWPAIAALLNGPLSRMSAPQVAASGNGPMSLNVARTAPNVPKMSQIENPENRSQRGGAL